MPKRKRLSDSISHKIVRRYIFKLHPTAAQSEVLHQQRRMMGLLWNALKERQETTYRRWRRNPDSETKRYLSFFDMTNEITQLRQECPEWAAIPAVTAYRVAKHLDEAFAAFFRRLKNGEEAGYPKWKKLNNSTTIPLGTMDKTGWRFEQRIDNPYSWLFHYKSVTNQKDKNTWIHARGILPSKVVDWRNADIIWRDNSWWLSICVCMEPRRAGGRIPYVIQFANNIGEFWKVNGISQTPPLLKSIQYSESILDDLKSERDQRWPRNKPKSYVEQEEYIDFQRNISHLEKKIRRRKKHAIHVCTFQIISQASALVVEKPPIKEYTESPRGDEKRWGANVKDVSNLNRNILFNSAYATAQMLEYKAKEAGIPYEVKDIKNPEIEVGKDLVKTGKYIRKAKRIVKAVDAA